MSRNLKIIDENAFYGCASIKELSLPFTLKILGNCAFAKCRSLETVILPNKRFKIEKKLFEGCDSLKTLVVDDRRSIKFMRWIQLGVPSSTNVVTHKALNEALLYAELTNPEISSERRSEIEELLNQ
jgi:hypothetical protein